MFPRPTGGGMLFTAAAAAALGTAFMNVGLITALIASLLNAFVLSGFLLSLFAALGFEIRRESMSEGKCMEKLALPLTVRNRIFLFRQPCIIAEDLKFAPGGRICWELPALAPMETIRIEREITAVKRGHFHLEKIQLIAGDPCGLFKVRKTFRLPGEILVLPQIHPLDNLTPGSGGKLSLTGEGRPTEHAGPGSDFFGVRPYRPGDEMRFVHWRLSASKKKLMVREFEAATLERIVLILDTNADLVGWDPIENNFEALVSLAASITGYFCSQYCLLAFYTYYENQLMQISGDAAGINFKITELLTELQPSKGKVENLLADLIEILPRGSILYLLSMSDSPLLRSMLGVLEDQDIHLQWICADKNGFPFVSEDEPMKIILPQQEKHFPENCGPRPLTRQTRWEELFQNETSET